MNIESFRKFLKGKGKSTNAIERIIRFSSEFDNFMKKKGKTIDEATEEDLYEFTGETKKEIDKKKLNLWGLISYFEFTENINMKVHAQKMRESVTKKKAFLLRDYVQINMEAVEKLEAVGIKDVDKLLKSSYDEKTVEVLSKKSGVEKEEIIKLVKLADLSRLNGVKGIRAVLYYNSGFDTLEKIANSSPEEIIEKTKEYILKTGFDGLPPWKKEALASINTSKKLKRKIYL